jgi:two-component system, chemotaxis family, chemotaxis protein CheV
MSKPNQSNENHSGKIEILLFSLGSAETYGLNVFKIREVTEMMPITKMPGQSGAMRGVVSLRGTVLPVIDLAASVNMYAGQEPTKLIISEFASRTVAFAVSGVDKIVRVDWSSVRPPQGFDSENSHTFGVVMLEGDRLVSLLDIESVCQREIPETDTSPVATFDLADAAPIFFVDDSLVARRQITNVLDTMGLRHSHAINGNEAQQKLMALVGGTDPNEGDVRNKVSLVLVDEEMPGMDGCTLTQSLKADKRFKNVPIVMYSSLTSEENERRGLQAGVDLYVKKFDSEKLSKAIGGLLERQAAHS